MGALQNGDRIKSPPSARWTWTPNNRQTALRTASPESGHAVGDCMSSVQLHLASRLGLPRIRSARYGAQETSRLISPILGGLTETCARDHSVQCSRPRVPVAGDHGSTRCIAMEHERAARRQGARQMSVAARTAKFTIHHESNRGASHTCGADWCVYILGSVHTVSDLPHQATP